MPLPEPPQRAAAGAAAAPSAGAAPSATAGATSFSAFGAVTAHTVEPASASGATPSPSLRSLTWMRSFMPSAVTSTSSLTGILSGVHEIGEDADDLVHDAAQLDALGLAGEDDRHRRVDRLVQVDADEVGVGDVAADRVLLIVAHHHGQRRRRRRERRPPSASSTVLVFLTGSSDFRSCGRIERQRHRLAAPGRSRSPGSCPRRAAGGRPPCRSRHEIRALSFPTSMIASFRNPLDEQRARDRIAVVDALDRLAEHARDRELLDLARRLGLGAAAGSCRSRSRSASGESSMRWMAGPENTRVGAQAETLRAPASMSALGRVGQRAGGVDDVVDDDGVLALDVADDVHDLGDVGPLAPLVDDGQASRRGAWSRRARARRRRRRARR